jgi:hypothetical protein
MHKSRMRSKATVKKEAKQTADVEESDGLSLQDWIEKADREERETSEAEEDQKTYRQKQRELFDPEDYDPFLGSL